jgi:CheY-specific phosphatase CheX
MAVKFFGQYLLEKQIIKPRELVEAVEYQDSRKRFFGEYAVSKGYLTKQDVDKLHKEQKHVDKRIGELAVHMGLLTGEQVEEILIMQRNDRIYLGEALVEKGFITRDVLEKELTLFEEDQRRYKTGEIILPAGVRNPDIVKDVVDVTQKMLLRLTQLAVKLGEGTLRNNEPHKNFSLISVSFHGKVKYKYAFSSSEETAKLIASSFLGDAEQNEPRDVIIDSVKEFCNITCGNIIAKSTLRGKNINIQPPEEVMYEDDGYHIVRGRTALYLPLISPNNECTLIFIEDA